MDVRGLRPADAAALAPLAAQLGYPTTLVDENSRSRGVDRALGVAAERWARAQDHRELRVRGLREGTLGAA